MTNENFNLFQSSNSTIFITVLFAVLFMFRIKVKKLTKISCASEKKKKKATTTTSFCEQEQSQMNIRRQIIFHFRILLTKRYQFECETHCTNIIHGWSFFYFDFFIKSRLDSLFFLFFCNVKNMFSLVYVFCARFLVETVISHNQIL